MRDVLTAPGKRVLDRIAEQGEALFAFDFDGTLARIVQDRDAAALTQPIREALHTLALKARTAIISGRALLDLQPRVEGIPTHLIGNHGLEGLHTSERVMHQARDCCRAWLKTVLKEQHILAKTGVVVEDKTYSLTFHYRQASSSQDARKAIFHTAALLSPAPRLVMGKVGGEHDSARQPAQGIGDAGVDAPAAKPSGPVHRRRRYRRRCLFIA